jgi:hypothetical protein
MINKAMATLTGCRPRHTKAAIAGHQEGTKPNPGAVINPEPAETVKWICPDLNLEQSIQR